MGNSVGLQTNIINTFHSSAIGGHSVIQATYQRVKKLFRWSSLKGAVESFAKECQDYY